MSIDLGCAASVVDPAGYFSPWLAAGDVHWSERQDGWAVLGHAAVAEAFRDSSTLSADRITTLERVASRRPAEFGVVVELLSGWMIFRDPPTHTRLRSPVGAAFTPRRVADLAPAIDAIVDGAIETMTRNARDGAADLTEHVARPVPALVVGALLGVDPSDRPRLQRWSDDLAAIVFSLAPSSTPVAGVVAAAEAFRDFFGEMVRMAPTRDPDSLVARIAALDTSFDHAELVGMCTLLLFAGHETTTSLIQNTVSLLLERPELADHLRGDPQTLGTAVEEILRVQGPARTMVRKVAVDHVRGGCELRRGDTVYLSIAAANHDGRVFREPATLDVARDPNPHLGFGWGLHHCLGARLARAETVAVLSRLLERFPELRPAGAIPPLSGGTMGFHRGTVSIRT